MIIHHPDRGTFHSIETLITIQVGQFWKAHPGKFSKAPKPNKFDLTQLFDALAEVSLETASEEKGIEVVAAGSTSITAMECPF